MSCSSYLLSPASETETDFGMNENALDLYIGEAHFEQGLEKELVLGLIP